MKKTAALAAAALVGLCGCASTKDLARTLRYSDNKPVGVENIRFVELERMKKGKACTVNFAYVVPLYGDGSIITAAEAGKINTVQLIGETGRWYFPFNTNCTVVFGDGDPAAVAAGNTGA
jgi:hypothetical protein